MSDIIKNFMFSLQVASLEETAEGKCVGLSYYNLYYTMGMMAQTPFQPRACRAR